MIQTTPRVPPPPSSPKNSSPGPGNLDRAIPKSGLVAKRPQMDQRLKTVLWPLSLSNPRDIQVLLLQSTEYYRVMIN